MLNTVMESFHLYTGEFVALMKKPKMFISQLVNLACIIATALMLWRTLALTTGSESPVVVVLSGSMEPACYRGDILFLTMWGEDKLKAGDTIVFSVQGRGIPIVHRILNSHESHPNIAAKIDEEADAIRKANKKQRKVRDSSNKPAESKAEIYLPDGAFKDTYRGLKVWVSETLKLKNFHLPKLALLTKGDNNRIDDRGLYDHRQKFIGRKEVMGRAFSFLPYIGIITICLNDYPWLKYLLIGMMGFFVMIGRESGGWV